MDCKISSLFSFNNLICSQCLNKFKVLYEYQTIDHVETLFLYEYDSFFKSILYQYKGCYDIALSEVFLYKFLYKLRIKYIGYTIVFPPSSKEDDEKRGFKHMFEIAKHLNLPILDAFYKKVNYKQSSHYYNQRKDISLVIDVKKNTKFNNKRYLIIDDIYTSGSTLKTTIKLLNKKGISNDNIKALILAKTSIK